MSGYCPDCGNTLCICKFIAEGALVEPAPAEPAPIDWRAWIEKKMSMRSDDFGHDCQELLIAESHALQEVGEKFLEHLTAYDSLVESLILAKKQRDEWAVKHNAVADERDDALAAASIHADEHRAARAEVERIREECYEWTAKMERKHIRYRAALERIANPQPFNVADKLALILSVEGFTNIAREALKEEK